MNIFRNNELEFNIHQKIIDNYKQHDREGIPLYACLNPRKFYFQKKFPKDLTITEILYFVSGKGIEKELTKLIGTKHVEARKEEEIFYAIDMENDEIITEIKSRRANLPKEGEEEKGFDSYISQVQGYCALEGKTKGNIVVVSLSERVDDSYKTEPVLACYSCTFSEEELIQKRNDLINRRKLLEQTLETDDFVNLPLCYDFMCGKQIKTCIEPPHCLTCKRDFSNDYFLKKHSQGAKTKGNEVKYGTYEWYWEPTCKYYPECGRKT